MPKTMTKLAKQRARKYLSERDGWKCHYCERPLIPDDNWTDFTVCYLDENGEITYSPKPGYEFPTIDHIQPLSRGGTNELSNTVLSCSRCNSSKGNR